MKKKIFSAICLLLSAVCIFSACRKDNGNGGSDEQTGSAASGDSTASSANDLVLPYSNNDSLNPFFAVGTENISLTDFDTVVRVAAETGYIKAEDEERLIRFRDNPTDESWIK